MKIKLDIDPEIAAQVEIFLATIEGRKDCTNGPLTMAALVHMLLEDVTLMVERPGSWEAQAMFSLLGAHGYEC